MHFLSLVIHSLVTVIPIIVIVAIFTLFERKLLSSVQRRRGPNVVGAWGFLQPVADGLKLGIKEFIVPGRAHPLFSISPIFILIIALGC